MTAISTEPKWSPTNRTALPGTTASAMSSGRIEREALVDEGRRDARLPGDLEVVAGRVAERRADEPLEGPRVGGGGPDRADCPCRTRRATGTTRRRLRRAWAARSGASRYQRSPASSANRKSGPSGRRQASHEAVSSRRPRTLMASASTAAVRALVLVGLVARQVACGSGVRPPGLHLERPALEVGASSARGRPDRLEAVPLLRRRADGFGDRVGDRLGRALEVGRVGRARPRSARRARPGAGRPAGGR